MPIKLREFNDLVKVGNEPPKLGVAEFLED